MTSVWCQEKMQLQKQQSAVNYWSVAQRKYMYPRALFSSEVLNLCIYILCNFLHYILTLLHFRVKYCTLNVKILIGARYQKIILDVFCKSESHPHKQNFKGDTVLIIKFFLLFWVTTRIALHVLLLKKHITFLTLASVAALNPPLSEMLCFSSCPFPVCSNWSAHTSLSQHCTPCLLLHAQKTILKSKTVKKQTRSLLECQVLSYD